MTGDESYDAALRLRRDFDASFSHAAAASGIPPEDLLVLGVAGNTYAVRVSEIAGVFKDRGVTRLPSPRAESLGLAGIRGAIIPVYDLRVLLGYPSGGSSRWLLLAFAPEPLAFAFDSFSGQLRVPREHRELAPPESPRRHVKRAVRIGDVVRQVIDVGSLVDAVKSGARPGGL